MCSYKTKKGSLHSTAQFFYVINKSSCRKERNLPAWLFGLKCKTNVQRALSSHCTYKTPSFVNSQKTFTVVSLLKKELFCHQTDFLLFYFCVIVWMWMVDVFISKKSCKLMEIQLKGQNVCLPSLVPPAELESLLGPEPPVWHPWYRDTCEL